MKRLLLILLFAFPMFLFSQTGFNKDNCTFTKQEHSDVRVIQLTGRVKVVEYGEDIRVKVVRSGEDIEVKTFEYDVSPDCGYWRFVERLESFRIKLVEYGEDIKIRFID